MPALHLISWCVALFSLTLIAGLRGQDKPSDFSIDDFDVPIFAESIPGLFVIEMESIPHSNRWELRTTTGEDGTTPLGDGTLFWIGPSQGVGHEEDHLQQYQGSKSDWLVIKLWATRTAFYNVRMRNYHELFDGDNDIWFGRIGQVTTINRRGSNVFKTYNWQDWGVPQVQIKKGLNAFYFAGRSQGFGLDRVVFYSPKDLEPTALSLDSPPSPIHTPSLFDGTALGARYGIWIDCPWGWLTDFYFPFVFHMDYGWLYCTGDSADSFYLYHFDSAEWYWSASSLLPLVYRFSTASFNQSL